MRPQEPRPGDQDPIARRQPGFRVADQRPATHKDHRPVEYSDRSGRWTPSPSKVLIDARTQVEFADMVCRMLRDSRKRQRLTQAEVSARTGGLVSKAALANYETGHRSLRIEVLWILARALDEDLGELLFTAEQSLSLHLDQQAPSVLIDPEVVRASEDPRLAPVRRWVELRQSNNPGGVAPGPMVLDAAAIDALASLMELTPQECAAVLQSLAGRHRPVLPVQTRPPAETPGIPDVG